MPCGPLPQLVHIRTATFCLSRCAGCDRRLAIGDASCEGNFPLSTPEYVVLIRARVCALCLADPSLAGPTGMRRMALVIFGHLGEWYAARTARSARRTLATPHRTQPAGCVRSRSRANSSGSQSPGSA
jgi:hypothetical protein